MSTVTLNIGPKSYTVACADGEEAHILQLGAMIAEKYAQLGPARAPLEAQNLLFAALFLADELAEARKQAGPAPSSPVIEANMADAEELAILRETVARLETELEAARQPPVERALAPATAPQPDLFGPSPSDEALASALAEQLEVLADRAEASAKTLEAAATSA